MAALIALATLAVFAAGVTSGIIGVVTVAIRREENNFTLTSKAPDQITRAGRQLNGVYVRATPPLPAADGTCLAHPAGTIKTTGRKADLVLEHRPQKCDLAPPPNQD